MHVTKKATKKKKKTLTEKIVNFIVIHVCVYVFSNIDSAFFECLPWSTSADIQFVSLQVSPFQFSKNYTAKSSHAVPLKSII